MHPNLAGSDGSLFEIPPYYYGRTNDASFTLSIPGALGGIVEQQSGYASQPDTSLWVINPPSSGNPAPWCVWDADDRVRGDFLGTLSAGAAVSVTVCMIADVSSHRAAMNLVGYPQLTGTIAFGEYMTLQVIGGRTACVVGPRYNGLSDTRLQPILNTNHASVGRYEQVTFTLTNLSATAVDVNVPMTLGRYLDGAPNFSESRWCPGDTADQGGQAIWGYGNWLYPSTDVASGAQPGVWWAN